VVNVVRLAAAATTHLGLAARILNSERAPRAGLQQEGTQACSVPARRVQHICRGLQGPLDPWHLAGAIVTADCLLSRCCTKWSEASKRHGAGCIAASIGAWGFWGCVGRAQIAFVNGAMNSLCRPRPLGSRAAAAAHQLCWLLPLSLLSVATPLKVTARSRVHPWLGRCWLMQVWVALHCLARILSFTECRCARGLGAAACCGEATATAAAAVRRVHPQRCDLPSQ
jgi:hypothetical protein